MKRSLDICLPKTENVSIYCLGERSGEKDQCGHWAGKHQL